MCSRDVIDGHKGHFELARYSTGLSRTRTLALGTFGSHKKFVVGWPLPFASTPRYYYSRTLRAPLHCFVRFLPGHATWR
jgi:hypothetical protein